MGSFKVHNLVRTLLVMMVAFAPVACAPPVPRDNFVPSKKSAVELRSLQTRVVPAPPDVTMRATIATLHDLGYRITKVEPDAGTVSGTRQTALRMAVVVQPHSTGQSVVRANATLIGLGREAQVDAPDFYRANFFEPLGVTLHRSLTDVPLGTAAPEAVRPTPEPPVLRLRQATAPNVPTGRAPVEGSPPR